MKWKSKKRYSHAEIVGERVISPEGVFLGRIERLMHEVGDGRVSFALVRFAGFLGLGNDLYPLPWATLNRRPGRQGFVFNIDRDLLLEAPTFAPDTRRAASNELADSIARHYGVERVAS